MRPVESVARALALLDALAADGPVGVNELARGIGVAPSTASRLLATMARDGVVMRDERGRFRLGLRLVALAEAALAGVDLRELARPALRALVADTGETATLSVPGGTDAVTIDFVPAESSVVSMARLGRPSVGHATAAGKVVLAFGSQGLPAGELAPFTGRTITDRAALEAEVERVRGQGWAVAVGEREADLNALAAPVRDRHGALAGVLGLQGPAARLTARRREEVLPTLLAAAARLSQLQG